MNLNADEFGGKGVVPVSCGGYVCGTAFFVSPTKLLTARHVLDEYILDKEAAIAVIVESKPRHCRMLYIDENQEADVAVLECVDYQSPKENMLKLLSCKFKKDIEALVVGFPRELGNGVDFFGVTVKNSREKTDRKGGFDCMVVRTDSFGFNSYDGFSGSPVINDFGMVIGIETDQLYNTLGYISVRAIKPIIEKYVEVEEGDDIYDNTPYGLWTSRNHIIHHTKDMLKTRYNSKVHIENKDAEKEILSFCDYGFEEERKELHTVLSDWYNKLAIPLKQYVDSIGPVAQYLKDASITDKLIEEIEGVLYVEADKRLPPYYYEELRDIYRRMSALVHGLKFYGKKQFLWVSGAAGCGKSHLLYYLSEKMTSTLRIYMFLGSEFSSLEDPVVTISRIMGWEGADPLGELNSEMQNVGRKATIIIDALNEGSGTHFWAEQLPVLRGRISRCSQLKLIVSLRNVSKEDQLNNILRDGWERLPLKGFTDRETAIKKYFETYNINADVTSYTKIVEFDNPLFLRMFCETYYSLSIEERNTVMRIPVYKKYLQKRNEEVSDGVDEDPKQDVTSQYILWVASRSVIQYHCGDVPRQKAFLRSQEICPFRPWTKSLLKNCLDANLLREYTTAEGDFVDFEFDSMGDYLKADLLLNRKCSESSRLKTLLRLYAIMNKNYQSKSGKWQKQYNFIRAFLSVWNPPTTIWQKQYFINGSLTSILLSSLSYRNVRDEENTLTSDIIGTIFQQNPDYVNPRLVLQYLTIYSSGLIDQVHKKLSSMSMAERDLFWTTLVNGLFDESAYMGIIEPLNPTLPQEIETLLITETWMLSSSHPYFRAYIIRKIKDLLAEHTYKTEWLIEKFHNVNDPYILEGLYAAIYGVVVKEDRADFSRSVAEKIYAYYYDGDGCAPQDLMVRHWTLKIFEFADHQEPAIEYWKKAQPPYKTSEGIFDVMPDEDYEDEDYFGGTWGGKQITKSLFGGDFSRYIIGTNNNSVSNIFFKNGMAVELRKIEQAIAFLIKHQFGWNDDLGKYDAGVPYQSRLENTMERIGKKYQWIGLYRVYAYLCDTCQMKINILSANERVAERNYPWYITEQNYFDPTLTGTNTALEETHNLFKPITPESTIQIPTKDWIEDASNMPQLYFVVPDSEGKEWVLLQAYSTIEEPDNDGKREMFVFYNGIFANKADYEKLKKWAADINFYGRWMRENRGSTDYMWNEFPWADTYRQVENDDKEVFNEGGINMTLAYSAQLQEDFKGIPEENQFLANVYMPSADIMDTMRWHTAERGIIRNEYGYIVAINRNIPKDPLQALLIRREQLDKYLDKKGLFLFWSLLGEKQYVRNIREFLMACLTGAATYFPGKGVDIIQPLREEPKETVSNSVSEGK